MLTRPLLSTVPYIWLEDEALDRSDAEAFARAWREYLRLGDIAQLPLKPGHTPAVFTLRPLTRKQILHAANIQGLAADAEVIAYSLVGLSGLTVGERPVTLEFTKTPLGDRLSERCLDEIFDMALFQDLAARAVEISRLDFRLGKAS